MDTVIAPISHKERGIIDEGRKNRVLVTGATGFLGGRLCFALTNAGNFVTGVGRKESVGAWNSWLVRDITKPIELGENERYDTIFHVAGKAHALSKTKKDDTEYFRVNTEGTRNVLEAAKSAGVRRFVLFSTTKAMSCDDNRTSIVGSNGGETTSERPLTEEDQVRPNTPYGKSKLEAEGLVLHGGYVPEPVVLRLCMVYGKGAKGNLANMLYAVKRRRFPALPAVQNRRSMVHVEDVVQAALLAGNSQSAIGEVFIVSDGRAYSSREIYEYMCHALGRPVSQWAVPLLVLRGLGYSGDLIGKVIRRRFVFDSDAFIKLMGSAWFSSEKIRMRLNFRPAWNLEMAIPEMLAGIE
jgi:UDP-glucose 4-epimerase